MRVIFKYPLDIADSFDVLIPPFKPFCVQLQNGIPYLWAETVVSAQPERKRFFCVGTGNPVPNEAYTYVGTVQMPPFVWHFYMEK
jgi:hypothetical protein